MPLGMCKSATTFQRMMNDIMPDSLHKFVTDCLDDVSVYNRNVEDQLEHLCLVL
jgi:hypothetical protein